MRPWIPGPRFARPGMTELTGGDSFCGRLLGRKVLFYEQPVVLPHVSHFMQVPLRTSVKF